MQLAQGTIHGKSLAHGHVGAVFAHFFYFVYMMFVYRQLQFISTYRQELIRAWLLVNIPLLPHGDPGTDESVGDAATALVCRAP